MSGSITESGLGLGLGLGLGPSRASTPKTHQHLHRRLLLRRIVGGGGGNVGPAGSSEAPEPLRLECRRQPREERNRTSPSPTPPSLVMFNNTHHQCCLSTSWRNPAAGFAPSWRSLVSALVAKARLIGNAGSSLSVFFFFDDFARAPSCLIDW